MSPWWRRHRRTEMKICERCGAVEDVHRGLCRHCRSQLLAAETPAGSGGDTPPAADLPPHPPSVEPPHDRPWVHRGAG